MAATATAKQLPTAAKQESTAPDKSAKRKRDKKGSRVPGAIIVTLIFLLLIGAGFAMLYFDFFESRQYTVAFMQGFDPEIKSVEQDLDEEWAMLENDRLGLDEWEVELDLREQELIEREDALYAREEAFNQAISPDNVNSPQNQQAAYMARIYGSMDTVKVAEIMQTMEDISQVVRIMRYMSVDQIASLMDAFEGEFAAQVSIEMIGRSTY